MVLEVSKRLPVAFNLKVPTNIRNIGEGERDCFQWAVENAVLQDLLTALLRCSQSSSICHTNLRNMVCSAGFRVVATPKSSYKWSCNSEN